jgi:hypothetical protein
MLRDHTNILSFHIFDLKWWCQLPVAPKTPAGKCRKNNSKAHLSSTAKKKLEPVKEDLWGGARAKGGKNVQKNGILNQWKFWLKENRLDSVMESREGAREE